MLLLLVGIVLRSIVYPVFIVLVLLLLGGIYDNY